MKGIKKLLCALSCAVMLCSCAERENKTPFESPSITTQTFNISVESEQTTTLETLNTDRLTVAEENTEPASRVPPTNSSEPSYTEASESTKAPESSSAPDPTVEDYQITPINSVMYASSDVNVREKPDADSKRIGHLDKGDKVDVTGLVSNGWVRIDFKGEERFVNGKYLGDKEPEAANPAKTEASEVTAAAVPETTLAPPETLPETDASQGEFEVANAEGKMTATDDLNVREKPDASSNKLGMLKKGDTVTVTGFCSNGWVRIIFEGKECFVSGEYLTVEPAPQQPEVPSLPVSGAFTGQNSYNALNYAEQKAVWLPYLDIDSMLKNADRTSFAASVGSAFDNVVSLGCNTVYVHVRAFGDAYYNSAYYPFTAAYSDTLGVAPDFDPLEIMIQQAHDRGLSFHAWINPMRTTNKTRYDQMPSEYPLKQWYDSSSTNGTFIVYDTDTGYYWLSPAYPAVRQLICNGVAEIVSRYNVDAIHIDDYFYPTTSASFDKAAFQTSGESDLASWRRSVVSSLVKDIYNTVKSCNKSVLFGVSPQGNLTNNRDKLYADVEKWCSSSGYLDYIVPQIYYGFNDRLSFDTAANQWQELVKSPDVMLVCGIGAYKVGINTEWSSCKILKKQTDYISDISAYSGVAYYRYGSFFGTDNSSEKCMKKEIPELIKAIAEF